MKDQLSRYSLFGMLPLLVLILMAGCSSQSGQGGAAPPPALVEQTYNEACNLCHNPGSIEDVAANHQVENNSPNVIVDLVSEATAATDPGAVPVGETRLKIEYRVFDNGAPIALIPASDIRFAIAKLVPGATPMDPADWQSYINSTETKAAGDPGTAPDGTTVAQATAERASTAGGTFTDFLNGGYSYITSFDITSVTNPVTGAPIPYDRSLLHRVAVQLSGNVDNAIYDFVPNGGMAPATKDVAMNASCNECHLKLGFHGGDRIAIEYCVTCHNPGSTDANSLNTVDFKVMIHKIHAGEELPEVMMGGEYAIWGFRNTKHDYSEVVYPQDLRRCTKCHTADDAGTPDGDNWRDAPSMAACTSCHEAPDPVEYPAFPNLTAMEIEETHQIPEQVATARFQFNILKVVKTEPGQYPRVTFTVTDPTMAHRTYDILNDPEFTAPFGASRLAILIGWPTTDYTNEGSETTPALPVSINPLSPGVAIANANGSYTVVSPVPIPEDVTGTGVAAVEGHPAVESEPGSGNYDIRVPVTSVFQYFPITDFVAQPRRQVVDLAKCNECHGSLNLHGNNRNNQIPVCVICHNADATDINRRPDDPATTADGKEEETIDFKNMIHAIHAGDKDFHGFRENGIVVYGFGGTEHDFSHVALPAGLDNLKNCMGCHITDPSTFELPWIGDNNALPTTVDTGDDIYTPDDDNNITPVASVCSSCHDSIFAKTHMTEEGANFDFVPFIPESTANGGGSEADLCGPGGTQPAGHTARTDCCSCHAIQ